MRSACAGPVALAFDRGKVCGKISVVADAHDITPLAVAASSQVSRLAARVTWSFAKLGAEDSEMNEVKGGGCQLAQLVGGKLQAGDLDRLAHLHDLVRRLQAAQ